MSEFAFEPVLASDALARFAAAPDGPVRVGGVDFANGAIAAMFNAERVAAMAGVVPWQTLPDGQQVILNVGTARDAIEHAPEPVRTLYLATHGIVRRTHATAHPHPQASVPELGDFGLTAAVVITVVAVAGIVATAYYYTRREEIQVDGANLRATELASKLCALAEAQLRATGTIQPDLLETIRALSPAADYEAKNAGGSLPGWAWVAGGVVLLGAAGVAAHKVGVL